MDNYPNKNQLQEIQNLGPLDRSHMEHIFNYEKSI